MELHEDWGMVLAEFSGIMGVLYAVLEWNLLMAVPSGLVIGLAYEVVKLRDYIRENEG